MAPEQLRERMRRAVVIKDEVSSCASYPDNGSVASSRAYSEVDGLDSGTSVSATLTATTGTPSVLAGVGAGVVATEASSPRPGAA